MGVPGRRNREVQQGEEGVVRRAAAVGTVESAREGKGVKTGVESKTGLRSKNKSSSH